MYFTWDGQYRQLPTLFSTELSDTGCFLVHSKQINETEPSISVKDIHAITMDLDAMDSLSFHYTLADIGFKTLNKTKT